MDAFRFNVVPVQTGELELAVGAEGTGLTVTLKLAPVLVHPLTVTVAVYVPAAAAVEEGMVGFCAVEENAFGPIQLYVAPATVEANKEIVVPAHTGELDDTVGFAGIGFTVTTVFEGALVHPPTVAVTV